MLGLPLDAGERLIARLRAVTPEQVKAVAAKYFGSSPAKTRGASDEFKLTSGGATPKRGKRQRESA